MITADSIDRSCAAYRLSSQQKQKLAMLARQAYEAQRGLVRGETKFDLWRHAQAIKACGRRISEALQGDYLTLKAHFLDLAGKPVAAMQAHMRHENEGQRIALHKLQSECAAKGLSIAYAAAICRTQNHCSLDEASAKQLWRLVFTIRNRKSTAPRRPARAPRHAMPEPVENFDDEDDNIPF